MGGMFGEPKFDVLQKIPSQYKPVSIRIDKDLSTDHVLQVLQKNRLSLPVIFKPDLGERGFMVKKISTQNDIDDYLTKIKVDYIIQEFVNLPLEFGIFYARNPRDDKGKVTSVVMKEMLTVTGDGKSTLQELILQKDRSKLQWEILKEKYHEHLFRVLDDGQKEVLVSIGNHCLGTTFLNYGHLINDKLCEAFDMISKQIDGFYFGRFDLRCTSIEDLYIGNVKIMELNGCGAEPAHIYHPGYSLSKALGELFNHWHTIFVISKENHKRGVHYISLKEARHYYSVFKRATAQ
jgi:hypothetical protein